MWRSCVLPLGEGWRVLLWCIYFAAIPFAIWLYLLLARGNFWKLREDEIAPKPLENWPRVVAVVPARNEAETIGRAIVSLAGHDYSGAFEIIVVDGQSEDGTAALARQADESLAA